MQINSIDQQPNFKQIRLSEAEMKNAQSRYKHMLNELENSNHNYKMFDIFESHLNKEVELKNCENTEIYKEYGDILFTYCENLKAKLDKFEIEVDDIKYSIPLNKQFDVLYNANKTPLINNTIKSTYNKKCYRFYKKE